MPAVLVALELDAWSRSEDRIDGRVGDDRLATSLTMQPEVTFA